MAKGLITTCLTVYHLWFLVYHGVPPQLHLHFSIIFITGFRIWYQQIHRKSSTRKKWKYEWRASGKPACINQQKSKNKKWRTRRSTKRSFAWLAGLAAGFQREWWSMKVVLQSHGETLRLGIKILPVLFMSYQRSPRAKVEPGSGKHSVFPQFPKDPNCDICSRTKITRASCRRTWWYSRAQSGTCWWLDYSGWPRSQWRKVNLETIIDVQSWCRTWQHSGYNHPRVKQKLLTKHQGACKSSWSQTGSLKSRTLTIPWTLANPVKISPGIIARQRHTDQEQMGVAERAVRSCKGRHLCCIVAIRSEWKLVGRFHGMLHLSAKHSRSLVWCEDTCERWFRMPFDGPVRPFGSNGRISPYFCERPIQTASVWTKSLPR